MKERKKILERSWYNGSCIKSTLLGENLVKTNRGEGGDGQSMGEKCAFASGGRGAN